MSLVKYTEFKGGRYVTLQDFSAATTTVQKKFYAGGCHIEHSHGHPSGTYLKVEDGKMAREVLAALRKT